MVASPLTVSDCSRHVPLRTSGGKDGWNGTSITGLTGRARHPKKKQPKEVEAKTASGNGLRLLPEAQPRATLRLGETSLCAIRSSLGPIPHGILPGEEHRRVTQGSSEGLAFSSWAQRQSPHLGPRSFCASPRPIRGSSQNAEASSLGWIDVFCLGRSCLYWTGALASKEDEFRRLRARLPVSQGLSISRRL